MNEFITSLWTKLQVFFSASWVVIYPFVKHFMSEAGAMALSMAPSVVAVIEDTMGDADGAAKRAEAFSRIEAALMAQGVKIAANIIYGAIEAAVAKLKATPNTIEEAKQLQSWLSKPDAIVNDAPAVQP